MPKLAANVSTLFPELGFLERFAAARRAGFVAVEYQSPYDFSAREVAAAAREAGVKVVLHNFPRGAPGESGLACLPGREADFREALERAIEYARLAGCERLHCLAGIAEPGADRHVLERTYLSNLRLAVERLKRAGLTLLLEPIGEGTVANYFLRSSAHAVRVLDALGADNAFVQYDIFHMQMVEGNLAATIERLLPRIGHMQLADVPGRHEPGTGEINFHFLLRHVDRLGYSGWIGCEYNPRGDTVQGLKWAKSYLA